MSFVKIAKEAPDGLLPEALAKRIHDPVLGIALQMMGALLFGLVFLMTIKPQFVEAIIVMVIALLLGLASGILFWYIQRRKGKIIR